MSKPAKFIQFQVVSSRHKESKSEVIYALDAEGQLWILVTAISLGPFDEWQPVLTGLGSLSSGQEPSATM